MAWHSLAIGNLGKSSQNEAFVIARMQDFSENENIFRKYQESGNNQDLAMEMMEDITY